MNILPLSHPSLDLDAVAALLTRVFSAREDQLEMIQLWLEDKARNVLIAEQGERCVGAMIVRLGTPTELDSYGAPFGVELAARYPDARMGAFQLLAVDPDFRRKGVANALAAAQLEWLLAAGVTYGVGISWDHGGFDGAGSSRPMFERAGFVEVARSGTFYREINAMSGQACPRCTPEPCYCEAILFVGALEKARTMSGPTAVLEESK